MNLVILGAGGIAHTHAQALQSSGAFNLVGVCGNTPQQVIEFAKQYNIRCYYSLDDLLKDDSVQIVSICTPSGLHSSQGRLLAQFGKHVLLEKPVALTVDDAKDLVNTCRQNKVFIGAFFQRRFEDDVIKLQDIINSGKLGDVFHLSLQMNWYRAPEYYFASNWRGTWAMDGGGALMNQSIHYVDMVCNLLGDPTNVFARTRTCMHSIEVDDLTMSIWQFKNGATCTYQVTTAAYPGFETRIEVYGTKGSVTMLNEKIMTIHTMDGENFTQTNFKAGAVSSPVVAFDNHAKIYQSFAKRLDQSSEFDECHAWNLIRPNAIISAIYQSSQQTCLVEIVKQ